MATLHEVTAAHEGASFLGLGPVEVYKQLPPKIARNGEPYSTVILKSAGNEMFLSLWGAASKCRLPLGETTLRGKFVKSSFKGSAGLRCEELVPPEGAGEFGDDEVQAAVGQPKMQDCLDAGLRAADYMVKRKRPELASAAFSFAAKARQQGLRLE